MRWQQGRRGTGYETLRFFSGMLGRFGLDAYLIRYPPGVGIPRHTDPVRNAKHYRCNLTLIQPRQGGDFLGRSLVRFGQWLTIFRPDIEPHEVTPGSSTRIVFSVGLADFGAVQ